MVLEPAVDIEYQVLYNNIYNKKESKETHTMTNTRKTYRVHGVRHHEVTLAEVKKYTDAVERYGEEANSWGIMALVDAEVYWLRDGVTRAYTFDLDIDETTTVPCIYFKH